MLVSMARDELFAGLCFLASINGLAGRAIQSIIRFGWTAALWDSFDTSAIAWGACGVGLLFLMHEKHDAVRSADLVVAVSSLILVMLPTVGMSWLALTGLSLYMLLFTHPPPLRRRGAVILLAVTVPMLWSRLAFHFFANSILKFDASLVGFVLGTDRAGNMVGFADGAGYMIIISGCSSLANTSFAFLCWVTIKQVLGCRWRPRDLLWGAAVCFAMIAVNVTRLSLMGSSVGYYTAVHNSWGDNIANVIGLSLAIAISLYGVRHELFSRT
jgi:hypothetical protein